MKDEKNHQWKDEKHEMRKISPVVISVLYEGVFKWKIFVTLSVSVWVVPSLEGNAQTGPELTWNQPTSFWMCSLAFCVCSWHVCQSLVNLWAKVSSQTTFSEVMVEGTVFVLLAVRTNSFVRRLLWLISLSKLVDNKQSGYYCPDCCWTILSSYSQKIVI